METLEETLSDFKPTGFNFNPTGFEVSPSTSRMALESLSGIREQLSFSNAPSAHTDAADAYAQMAGRMKPQGELLFAPSIDARLRIRRPFRVRIERSKEGISAGALDIEEFGHGSTRSDALNDLGKTIAELYFSLESERKRLSSDLANVLAVLESHIARVHA